MTDIDLRQSGIYCIRNIVSRRIYVGSAVNISARWIEHKKRLRLGTHHSQVFQRSWNKHGQDAFQISVLEIVDNAANLVSREQVWIDCLKAACPRTGLNRSPTAGSTLGLRFKQTGATLERNRKWLIEQNQSQAHRRLVSASKLGRPKPAAIRIKISEALRGRKLPPRTKLHQRRVNLAHAKRKRLGGTQLNFVFIQRQRPKRVRPKAAPAEQ